jgi:hypothetical protein
MKRAIDPEFVEGNVVDRSRELRAGQEIERHASLK